MKLINKKFGKLTIVKEGKRNKHGHRVYVCLCDCGNKLIVIENHLKSGHTKSCGCLRKAIMTTHGYGHDSVYRIWSDIKQRCNNPKNKNYKDYGERGITICDRWLTFINFLEDMGEPPTDKHQIDRVNNDMGYYKENCRWVLSKQNNRNKRNNYLILHNKKIKCLTEWAEYYNIRKDTLWCRLHKLKWSIEKALTTPIKIYEK